MRVWVEDSKAAARAIKELGLRRNDQAGTLLGDEYLTVMNTKVTFIVEDGLEYKDNSVKGWRAEE